MVLNEPPRDSTIVPQALDLDILYRDEHVIVINKQPGLVCHPGHGNYEGTLVHGLAHLAENLPVGKQGEERPGLVHRLDKTPQVSWLLQPQSLVWRIWQSSFLTVLPLGNMLP